MSRPAYDVIIKNGFHFDGTGKPGAMRHLGIRGKRLVTVSGTPLDETGCPTLIDAQGQWVMPGFLDTHTHYDAEVVAAPSLSESVRHGVTTVTIGSCSISMILSAAEDCSDLFTRVESVPREQVLPLLQQRKTWNTPKGYVDFLKQHPLGPNVCSFLGHSDLRVAAMGLDRAVDSKSKPTEAELTRMEQWLEEGLDAGLLGLSTMTTKWDKLDGDRQRSKSLPSTYAGWGEFRRLNRILRRRRAIHQGAPNIVTKLNMFLFLAESAGSLWRPKLKTTLITLMDIKANPLLHRVVGPFTNWWNKLTVSDFRWQALPVQFEVYADGIDLVIFEEFGAGEAALHLSEQVERNALFADEAYRRKFRKDYERKWGPRVWHRDLHDSDIVDCPDKSLVGRSFGEIADQRGLHPVDLFLDLVTQYGKALRWHTVLANHRPQAVKRIMKEPATIVTFSDAGAHIRNMAFYNFPLRFLKLVRDSDRSGERFMPLETAVWRLTGELGDWFGIDAGHLREGDRADVVIINPEALDERLEAYHEAPMEGLNGLQRMVNRSDGAVSTVLVNGRVAFRQREFAEDFGKERNYGEFLAAR
ncbi:N-acyl-D-aspartate/D-glutamate deacylase [Fluviicoccus keumensis]|uniref:N-acyl-D-aspartate/D-glutamate deacylase n=1 Tax=Fluviicoccus keumensis TaxID=1435465 RepID=A0A4Q7ZAD4_9GAMM|nr:amidohydrolase family protein [Fluviicoccus keumensis]RZU47074.1 N-acyl-D-aspartate/D-glutamate deacylase [Fluviicoccus keumensis]